MDFKRSSQRFFEKKKDRLFETWKIRHFKVERKVLKSLEMLPEKDEKNIFIYFRKSLFSG